MEINDKFRAILYHGIFGIVVLFATFLTAVCINQLTNGWADPSSESYFRQKTVKINDLRLRILQENSRMDWENWSEEKKITSNSIVYDVHKDVKRMKKILEDNKKDLDSKNIRSKIWMLVNRIRSLDRECVSLLSMK